MVHGFLSVIGLINRAAQYFEQAAEEIRKMAGERVFPRRILIHRSYTLRCDQKMKEPRDSQVTLEMNNLVNSVK
jgi:hypothetical protein